MLFCFIHHGSANASPLVIRMNGKIIDTTTVAVIPGHDGSNKAAV